MVRTLLALACLTLACMSRARRTSLSARAMQTADSELKVEVEANSAVDSSLAGCTLQELRSVFNGGLFNHGQVDSAGDMDEAKHAYCLKWYSWQNFLHNNVGRCFADESLHDEMALVELKLGTRTCQYYLG